MDRKRISTLILMAIVGFGSPIMAQFNTIRDLRGESYEIINRPQMNDKIIENKQDTIVIPKDTILAEVPAEPTACNMKTDISRPVRKKHLDYNRHYEGLPGLTLNNLLREIRKCGIRHEKVVLAQAILETGWFTSSVCRNKNNLFGLTNPRTGQYYEFSHWTESVAAYYKLVQHRYKGGNYLLWLDEIGYAEAKTYVASLIRLMREYFV